MRKHDLIKAVVHKTHIEKADVTEIVDAFLEEIKEALATRNSQPATRKITLRGFGTFINKKHGPKKVRDIKRRKPMTMPAYHKIHFKPSKKLWPTH